MASGHSAGHTNSHDTALQGRQPVIGSVHWDALHTMGIYRGIDTFKLASLADWGQHGNQLAHGSSSAGFQGEL